MKKGIQGAFLLVLTALLCMLQISVAADSVSWYTVRNKAHRQPQFGKDLSIVEEYNGYFIDHAHTAQEGERVVYLTFDAGYENGNVAKILDVLKQKEVKGAFFVLKHLIEANGDLVMRMEKEGHTVCNHTASHPDLSAASADRIRSEITELEESYRALTGKEMAKFFRPPEGKFSETMLKTVSELGYKTVFWSFAYADWDNNAQPTAQKAMQCIMDNVHNGAVMLLHPTSATNAAVLPSVIDELRAQGYRFGTLDQLCGAE
jgi:peptidoglycan-N-acetylmuramic acid deacetylase